MMTKPCFLCGSPEAVDVKMKDGSSAAGFTMYPDAAFQLVTVAGKKFNFFLELGN